jgi:uncharacterized protein (TIGR01777 family)
MARVLVTGATGFIGRAIVKALLGRGDAVVVLTRSQARAGELGDVEVIGADLESAGAWQAEVAGTDAVIHLAGEPIAGRRWNAMVKQQIHDSRVEGTARLVEAIAAAAPERRPRVLVSTSGVDYYPFADGPRGFDDDDVPETDAPSDGFLARVCRDWEAEAQLAEQHGVRVVRMRTGVVLGAGGALAKMTGAFRFFVGGKIGSGHQWFSWIHLDDVVAAYLAAVDDARYTGPVNLVAPEPARARDVARALGAALGRPSWLPVPGFALKAAVGAEFAEHLLHGRKVVPRALEKWGFRFAHPTLAGALESALRPAPDRTSARAG